MSPETICHLLSIHPDINLWSAKPFVEIAFDFIPIGHLLWKTSRYTWWWYSCFNLKHHGIPGTDWLSLGSSRWDVSMVCLWEDGHHSNNINVVACLQRRVLHQGWSGWWCSQNVQFTHRHWELHYLGALWRCRWQHRSACAYFVRLSKHFPIKNSVSDFQVIKSNMLS